MAQTTGTNTGLDSLWYFDTDNADLQFREDTTGEPGSPPVRVLAGTVVRYGDTAIIKGPGGVAIRERILPGAFGDVAKTQMNAVLQHNRDRTVAANGYGLKLFDSPTELRAEISLDDSFDAMEAYKKYKNGTIRGLSPEFYPVKSRYEGGVLLREVAPTIRLGLVDKPAYPDSKLVEARAAEIALYSVPKGTEKAPLPRWL